MQQMEDIEINSNSASSADSRHCRICKEELIVGCNVLRRDIKTCKTCADKRKQELNDLKIPKIGHVTCKKCKCNFPKEQFIKMLVCCVNCRSKNTKKEKKGKIAQDAEDAEDTDSKLDITLKDIYYYFIDKYKLKDRLEDVIKEIIEQEQSERESENNESEEEQQH